MEIRKERDEKTAARAAELNERGVEAYRALDEETAAALFRKAAELGDPDAQCNLAALYEEGEGVGADIHQAWSWYEKAAEQGVAEAQLALGRLWSSAERMDEALKWYRKAAEQGKAAAQLWLGSRYYDGDGVPEDKEQAFKWYLAAAEQDVFEFGYVRHQAEIQYKVSRMYGLGEGVGQNDAAALRWCILAAENGSAEAQLALGDRYYHGDGVLESKDKAFRNYLAAAEQFNWEAACKAGEMCWNEECAPGDRLAARMWFTKEAAYRGPLYQYLAGELWGFDGTDEEDQTALGWFLKAANRGVARAAFRVGWAYFSGVVDGSEYWDEAREWFIKAAELGDLEAQLQTAWMYYQDWDCGDAAGPDRAGEEAMKWYLRAAGQGEVYARYAVGALYQRRYERGGGVQDKAEAEGWFRTAAAEGSEEAAEFLEKGGDPDGRTRFRLCP